MAEAAGFERNSSLDKALGGGALSGNIDDLVTQQKQRSEAFSQKTEETVAELDKSQEKRDAATFDLTKAADKAAAALKQPVPEENVRSPMEGFGSAASLLAVFGSLLTREPLVNALNASAGVMNAYRAQDRDAFDKAMETYKINIDNAKTIYGFQKDAYDSIMKNTELSDKAKVAKLSAYAAAFKDEAMQTLLLTKEQDRVILDREKYANQFEMQSQRLQATMENLALRQQQFELSKDKADAANWQAMVDTGRKDADGNPTPFMWNKATGQAATFDKSGPYTPVSPMKIGTASAGSADKPLTLPQLQAKAAQQKIDELKTSLGREPTADEKVQAIQQVKSGAIPQTEEERMSSAALASTGMPFNQIVYGYGAAAVEARTQLKNDTIKLIQSQNPGMSAEEAAVELANRDIEFQAGKKSVSQLTTVLGSLKPALDQLDYNIDKTEEQLKKVGSSDLSPVINAIRNQVQEWTGNPELRTLWYYMNGVATESARILSGGTASVAQLHSGAAEEAKKWADASMTPSSFHRIGEAMKGEARNRVTNYENAIKSQRVGLTPKASGVPHVTTQAEFDKLPSGARYIEPDGKEYIKP